MYQVCGLVIRFLIEMGLHCESHKTLWKLNDESSAEFQWRVSDWFSSTVAASGYTKSLHSVFCDFKALSEWNKFLVLAWISMILKNIISPKYSFPNFFIPFDVLIKSKNNNCTIFRRYMNYSEYIKVYQAGGRSFPHAICSVG